MQWKARYTDGQELWETPESSTALLEHAKLSSFELVEDGMVLHCWMFSQPTSFGYILRTRIPLLAEGEPESFRLVRFGDTVTHIYDQHTETSTDLTDFLPAITE